jgi:hypothetical protein
LSNSQSETGGAVKRMEHLSLAEGKVRMIMPPPTFGLR